MMELLRRFFVDFLGNGRAGTVRCYRSLDCGEKTRKGVQRKHFPNSPDLAASDKHVFTQLEEYLKVVNFCSTVR